MMHQTTPTETVQKKKPLPKIPKLTVDQQKHRHSTPIVPGPSWITTAVVESPQMMHNDLLLTQAAAAPQPYHHDSNAYYYAPPQQYYYNNWNQCNNVFDSNQEWKTSFKNSTTTTRSSPTATTLITRSDSLKIESSMSVPVPFLKNGLLPLETHFEKPYEPPSEEITASQQIKTTMLQRKISKEEVCSVEDQEEAPHSNSILLQKLNQFSNRTTPVHASNEQDNGAACAQIAATFLSFNDKIEKDTSLNTTTTSSSSNSSSSLSTPSYSVSSFSYHPASTSTTSLNTCNQRPGPSTSTSSSNEHKLQRHCNSMPLLTAANEFDEQQQQEEEDPSYAFSAAEKYFDQPASASSVSTPRIPSPWDTSNSKSSFSMASNGNNKKIISRISTGSIPNLAIYTAQVPDEISLESSIGNEATTDANGRNMSQAEQYFNVHGNIQSVASSASDAIAISSTDSHLQEAPGPASTKYSLSIASCSLINIRSNTKLYRRMALKTRNDETQLTYAKYLLQISKLYDKHSTTQPSNKIAPISMASSSNAGSTNHGNHDANLTNTKRHLQETPAQTRHRLLSEAGYWIERLAKAGKPEALFIKGRWYLLGPQAEDCVLKGYEKAQETKAFKCFLRASKGGWTEAHYELAHLWKKRGNFAKAIQCYEKGAKEQHTLSIYKMAKILLRGQLKKKKDLIKGMQYLKQAADMNDSACAEPAFVLGCIYANEFDRIGIQRYVDEASKTPIHNTKEKVNYSLALKYLKKSAHHGYPDAIYFMGQVSETGMLGQLQDSWQAYQHYMKAAEVNHAGAMLDLSRIYSQGISGLLAIQKDTAFKWCKRSADLGFDQAEYVLGKYYEDGIGVAPDFPRALEYFGKAASKGYQPAAEKLNRPMADGSRRRRTVKKDEQDHAATGKKFIPVVVSLPKVKQDDDDDHDTDHDDDTRHKLNANSNGNNICAIQ
ncbi:glycoside hydrolase 3 protein [Mucor velutinosus]|uniref:Glycoside hydrolase 3 protein n=1 Tax=Mucor velutinosus TaxID=708070 RepID=A0AAN7HTL1_9FUNG|nr:glycoside hydrolase 3 protein [Mucor velutinosus]